MGWKILWDSYSHFSFGSDRVCAQKSLHSRVFLLEIPREGPDCPVPDSWAFPESILLQHYLACCGGENARMCTKVQSLYYALSFGRQKLLSQYYERENWDSKRLRYLPRPYSRCLKVQDLYACLSSSQPPAYYPESFEKGMGEVRTVAHTL